MTLTSPSASLPGKEKRGLSPGSPQDEAKHFRSSQEQGGSMPVPSPSPSVLLDMFKRLILGQGGLVEPAGSLELQF